MKITLNSVGKKFNRDWIFQNVSKEFQAGNQYAILGPNGSGKSTLLQVIAGNITASAGNICYEKSETGNRKSEINGDEVYTHISICAPYLQLIEEFTVEELISFHVQFKPLAANITNEQAIEMLELPNVSGKQIRYFSSGMKQRVKLGLALLSKSSLVILDEPLTNLDDKAKQWFYNLIEKYSTNRIILVGSNRADEYTFCKQQMNILDYKK